MAGESLGGVFKAVILVSCGFVFCSVRARADDPVDSVMYRDPDLPMPKLVATFPETLLGLWLQALERPEADTRCKASTTIDLAHEGGNAGKWAVMHSLRRVLELRG